VGTALNGVQAEEQRKKLNPDVITLDIHMPEMTGLEYLKKNYSKSHPPVIMVSSVAREDNDTVMQCLALGASDFIEKPSFSNLENITEELKTKLRSAFNNWNPSLAQQTIQMPKPPRVEEVCLVNPNEQIRIILCSLTDKSRVEDLLNQSPHPQSPTLILVEASKETLQQWAKSTEGNKTPINYTEKIEKLDSYNQIYLAETKLLGQVIKQNLQHRKASILIYGEINLSHQSWFSNWPRAQILLEDLGSSKMVKSPLSKMASDIVPVTSFSYMSHNYLWKK
jgi:chemotaxis protein methyltransferase CheR